MKLLQKIDTTFFRHSVYFNCTVVYFAKQTHGG